MVRKVKYCECGCGQEIIFKPHHSYYPVRFIYGHNNKGKNHPMYGKHHTKEARQKMSKALKGKIFSEEHKQKIGKTHRGKNHFNWRGGISFKPYPPSFNQQRKERIRVRDNFICQLCGVPELECNRRLSVHHIDYDKNNCRHNNLISLCRSCNSRVNYNRNKWTEHFQRKVAQSYG